MTREKKPPASTALVKAAGPPDAAIVKVLREAHGLFKGNLKTAVCTVPGGQGEARLGWERPQDVDRDGAYLVADAATYEIVGAARAGRFYLKDGCRLASGARFLLVPMPSA